jgi:hypothetical protein
MAEITEQSVQEKLNKGETLTKEETSFVMGTPPDPKEAGNDEDGAFDGMEEVENKPASGTKDEPAKSEKEEKPAEPAKAEKKADEAPADPSKAAPEVKKDEGNLIVRIETELAKAEGQEDLSGLSDREKGLFWSLRKERSKRQKAEEDRDVLLFQDIKKRKEGEAKAKEEEAKKPKRDPEDFITVKDLEEQEAAERAEQGARERSTLLKVASMNAHDVLEVRRSNGQDLPDYDTVMAIAEKIVEENDEYKRQIYEAYKKGKNPALFVYDLVRKDPQFLKLYKPAEKPADPTAAPKDEKSAEAKKTLDKINENEKKPKTSGAQGGGAGGGETHEYTIQELADMSPAQFRKVPKQIRERFLRGDA